MKSKKNEGVVQSLEEALLGEIPEGGEDYSQAEKTLMYPAGEGLDSASGLGSVAKRVAAQQIHDSDHPVSFEKTKSLETAENIENAMEQFLSQSEGDERAKVTPEVSSDDGKTVRIEDLNGEDFAFEEPAQAPNSFFGEKTIAATGVGYNNPASERVGETLVGGQAGINAAELTISPAKATIAPTELALVQSENLRVAQRRILELEEEVERLRSENEELASASEILRQKTEELKAKSDDLQALSKEAKKIHNGEIEILKSGLSHKELNNAQLKEKAEELEMRLAADLKKVRVRERELSNRLELMKSEKTTLLRSKDEMIIQLQEKMNQAHMESESYRQKCQELNRQISENKDKFRDTVRALRLALSKLELENSQIHNMLKAE